MKLRYVVKWFMVVSLMFTCIVPVAQAGPTERATASDRAYQWLKAQQDLTAGYAMEGLVDSFDDWWSATERRQIVYTYDQAVAAIAFMLEGDRARAEKVLDKLAAIQDPDGSWINSYWWNGYGEEIRKHVGPVAWVAMAYMSYEKLYGSNRYDASAKKAMDWIITFQKPNGGIAGGRTTWDLNGAWSDEVWSSTEHNQDVYNLLRYYATKFNDRTTAYNQAAADVKSFLDYVVWDDTLKRWYGGFKNDTSLKDPLVPMDVNPWGVMALGLTGTRNYQASIDYVEHANGNGTSPASPKYAHALPYSNTTITAYDFDWQSDCAPGSTQTGQPNGERCADIWFEGSAFMSVAYAMRGNTDQSNYIIDEIIKKQGTSSTLLGGVPYSLRGTNNNYWKMAQENCVSSTGWLIIAIAKYNPFTASYISGVSTPNPEPETNPQPSGDYSVQIDKSGNTAVLTFAGNTGVTNPIIHYQSSALYNGAQQNVYMTSNGNGNYSISISGLSTGHVVNYSFTYLKSNVQQPQTTSNSFTF